jgi:LysR family glycine cleavage system transcriptional activator
MITVLPSTQAIEAFEAAARLLSFEAAARELNVTPSAISHRIARLEKLSGLKLFRRTVRRITLAPEGERLLAEARNVLAALGQFVASTSPASLRISATPMFGMSIVLPWLEEFHDCHPGIRVTLDMATASETLGSYDAVIRHGKLARRDWISRPILSTRLVPVQSPDAGFGKNRPYPLIAYSYSRSTWRGVVPDGTPTDSDTLVVPGMVEAIAAAKYGRGVALVVERFVHDELRSGALVRIPCWKAKRSTFYFCFFRRHASRGARTFGDWLKERLAEPSL